MITKFKEKLKSEGRNYRWFHLTYLPDMKYHTIMAQINNYNPITEQVAEAIKKYLGEK